MQESTASLLWQEQSKRQNQVAGNVRVAVPGRDVGVQAHPGGVWNLPWEYLGGEQSMCRTTEIWHYMEGPENLSIFRREVIACVAVFLVKSFEILIFVSEIPCCSTSISTASA